VPWQMTAAAWADPAGDRFADQNESMPKYVGSETLADNELTCVLLRGGALVRNA
jgi:hypothetical protein